MVGNDFESSLFEPVKSCLLEGSKAKIGLKKLPNGKYIQTRREGVTPSFLKARVKKRKIL